MVQIYLQSTVRKMTDVGSFHRDTIPVAIIPTVPVDFFVGVWPSKSRLRAWDDKCNGCRVIKML